MSKQISKDNREYWLKKLSSKFSDKKEAIVSLHQVEINEQTQKNFPIFKKRLGIEKDLTNYIKVERDFNDYVRNYTKRLEEKREQVKKLFSKVRDKLSAWSETRKTWNEYDIPKYDYESKLFDLSDRVENFLKDTCKTETKEAFYKSKKGKEIQTLEELEEKATDLLHSDMIGSEVLSQISMIAKQTNINMTIPQNTLKELPSK
jgi:ribosomal protein S25